MGKVREARSIGLQRPWLPCISGSGMALGVALSVPLHERFMKAEMGS